jgi:hypothetical protein
MASMFFEVTKKDHLKADTCYRKNKFEEWYMQMTIDILHACFGNSLFPTTCSKHRKQSPYWQIAKNFN